MNPEVRRKWADALRSGEYAQGRNGLAGRLADGSTQHCCLGVLCEVALKDGLSLVVDERPADPATGVVSDMAYSGRLGYLPRSVAEWAGLAGELIDDVSAQDVLADLNDNGATFDRIADLIEELL